jgi:hypothetical protein
MVTLSFRTMKAQSLVLFLCLLDAENNSRLKGEGL